LILLIVWDGLRPDMVREETTPFLFEMAGRGVVCRASHCAFPTATRINSASLATGCYPRKHGIVDNELYVPALDAERPISCADWRALQAMADAEGGRLVDAPTLGELLRAAGKQMVSVGSGSPGTTYLTNPTVTGPIVNWAVTWPEDDEAIAARLGGPLSAESDSPARNAYVLQTLTEELLPRWRPDLATIWLTEPDHAQHYHGLGSPEALAALRALDDQLRELVDTAASLDDSLTCFLLSDHGFDTIERLDAEPVDELRAAGLVSSESPDVVRASNSLYLNGAARDRLEEIVAFLLERPWLGALWVRQDLRQRAPFLQPQEAVFGGHPRSAELLLSFRWSDAANAVGVPGHMASPSSIAATHGSGSPYALNNTLIAWGTGIKSGVVSDVPCGIVDIAPTALYLLRVNPPRGMDGRVLGELLKGGPNPDSVLVRRSVREAAYPGTQGTRIQRIHYSHVACTDYIDRVTLSPPPTRDIERNEP
jgi:predicted AlkP superfamily pyrophosphatase or phosphodiesterase